MFKLLWLGVAVAVTLCGQSLSTQIDYLTQVKNKPQYEAAEYAWSRTNGLGASGNLSSSGTGRTIILTPPPKGVYGSSSNHYVYISGGTGTAEAALITGGTCASDSVGSCSIIVTTANSHTGSWRVATATAGGMEAYWMNGGTGDIHIHFSKGVHEFFASMVVASGNVLVSGDGYGTMIKPQFSSGDVFLFTSATQAFGNQIRDLKIENFDLASSGRVGVQANNQIHFRADGVWIRNVLTAWSVTGSSGTLWINQWTADNFESGGYGVLVNNDTAAPEDAEFTISKGMLVGSGTAPLAAIQISHGNGLQIQDNSVYAAVVGLSIVPGNNQLANWTFSYGNRWDSCSNTGVIIQPTGTGRVQGFFSVNDWAATNTNYGALIGGGGGTVDGVSLTSFRAVNNGQYGIVLNTGTVNTVFNNVWASGNSTTSSGNYSGLVVGAGVSQWKVIGGIYGPTQTYLDTQNTGIQVLSGSSDHYSIIGANLNGNTVARMIDDGTGLNKIIRDNSGVDDAAPPTVASATSVTIPANGTPVVKISGTTTITTINGGWNGRRIRMVKTDAGSATVGGGGNVPGSHTLSQNGALDLTFDGTNWY